MLCKNIVKISYIKMVTEYLNTYLSGVSILLFTCSSKNYTLVVIIKMRGQGK